LVASGGSCLNRHLSYHKLRLYLSLSGGSLPPRPHVAKWNIPQRLRKNPNRMSENAHFRALLLWRNHMTLMAKQLLSKGRITELEEPLWQKKRF
jgi:hypothetical protein